GGSDVVVMRPGPGEYFGEVELMRGGRNIASIRAMSEVPVELVTLDRESFMSLMSEADSTRDALAIIADRRAEENVQARKGGAK
ncbi:MAG: cyclic nucleotide-binding domain-containing protein, partial [Anaerolineales bacterium]